MSTDERLKLEAEDARKVDAAAERLYRGNVKPAVAALLDVASRAPDVYTREFVVDGTRYIRFWDLQQFTHFCTDPSNRIEQKVVWLLSAYPRAFFYLGFAHVKLKDPAAAIEFLDRGIKLEPHPLLLAERGKALSELNRHDLALASYEAAFALPGSFPAQIRAVALRGKGFQLIELNQLDRAEEAFVQSLELDPNNSLAMNELRYITELRRGGRIAPRQTVVAGGGALQCAVCGLELGDGGVVTNMDGRVVWRCRQCATKLPAGPGSPGLPSASSAVQVHINTPEKPRRAWWKLWR